MKKQILIILSLFVSSVNAEYQAKIINDTNLYVTLTGLDTHYKKELKPKQETHFTFSDFEAQERLHVSAPNQKGTCGGFVKEIEDMNLEIKTTYKIKLGKCVGNQQSLTYTIS